MSDQCRNCTVRGEYEACIATPCSKHESWIDIVRIERIKELEKLIEAMGWAPISAAPKDRTVIVYAPPRQDLSEMVSFCKWDQWGGFCIDEMREPTHFISKPGYNYTGSTDFGGKEKLKELILMIEKLLGRIDNIEPYETAEDIAFTLHGEAWEVGELLKSIKG